MYKRAEREKAKTTIQAVTVIKRAVQQQTILNVFIIHDSR